MTTIYSLYNPYGNYLDNYYVEDYDSFISFLLSDTNLHTEKVNLGIVDGVTIQNRLHGDYREYNCLIVEDEDGNRNLYKIIDKTFVRRNIWQITAKLDVFSKDYKNILNADILVKRLGYREYTDFSPLLFNDEGFTLSNVKKEQKGITFTDTTVENNTDLVLGDDIKLEAFLLIFAKDALNSSLSKTTIDAEITTPDPDYEVDNLQEWLPYKYKYCFSHMNFYIEEINGDNTFYFWWLFRGLTTNYSDAAAYTITNYNGATGKVTGSYVETAIRTQTNNQTSQYIGQSNHTFVTDVPTLGWYNTYYEVTPPSLEEVAKTIEEASIKYIDATSIRGGHLSLDDYKESDFNGKIVYDKKTGNYYKMTTTSLKGQSYEITFSHDYFLAEALGLKEDEGYGSLWVIASINDGFSIDFEQLSITQTSKYEFTISAKQNTIDEGNPVLVVPYIETDLPVYFNGTKIDKSVILPCIRGLQQQYMGDSAKLLDVQRVPFLPTPVRYQNTDFKMTINTDGVYMTYLDSSISKYFQIVKSTENELLFITYALTYCEDTITNSDVTITIDNYKKEQVNKYILCSPSGSSTYEFSPAMNKGIYGWRLKYNIRPIETMIQVQPIYNGYYGTNFIDTRGAVMVEDISLTQYSSAWETYKRENVNYINSFESNINYERSQLDLQQNYEKQSYKLQRIQSGINSTMNYLSSGAKAVGNFSIGNIGDAAADVGSAFSSIYGEMTNAIVGKKQLNLQLQYETDSLAISQAEERKQWNYSLGNIKAIPTNTDKTCGIYNTNYGVFYYEKYEPTAYELYVYNKYIDLFGISIDQVVPLNTVEFDYIEGDVVLYKEPITQEEYTELQEELQEGRRLYEWQ